MLVLTRDIGQEIVIGQESIIIKVLNICGTQVRLGLEAPPNLSIHRREIYNRITGIEGQEPKEYKKPVKRIISEGELKNEY